MMKKYLIIPMAVLFLASCQKPAVKEQELGYLSFEEASLSFDEEVVTKAYSAAPGSYTITILDSDDKTVYQAYYSEVKNNGDMISLPAGDYTLVAQSDELPVAAFEQPVYGTSKRFSIQAGEQTFIGELVCTLLQCKVTVAYSDEFLATVTGECTTKVELTSGSPLDYKITQNGTRYTYDQSAGYFAVNGTTMTVMFKGSVEGKTKSQVKTFSNIAAKQWRQIKFIQKVNEEGEATFDIVINDLISDAVLNNSVDTDEQIIADDPYAPKGDGGITLALDYEGGCDPEITDLQNILIAPVSERDMAIRFKATVPGGVKKFMVNIESTNNAFVAAVSAAQARELDLINPSEANAIIFDVVPFPHGAELLGQTDIAFNLDAAQDPILNYKGTHTFTMNIVDNDGCRNQIPVVMIVE